jgi:hypothetical protein
VLLTALSLFLVHCEASEGTAGNRADGQSGKHGSSSGDDGAGGDDDDGDVGGPGKSSSSSGGNAETTPVPREDPPLMFTFDGRTRVLRARVRQSMATGASVVFGLFAVGTGENRAVDCAALGKARRPVDLSNAQPSGNAVVTDLPVDASVFSGRLDGTTRTNIQGCLLDANGQVVVKMSTSLMNAWDSDETTASATPRIFHGIEAYANSCADELGEFPMFEGGADFDCVRNADMQVVPITATNSNGTVVKLTKDTAWPLGSAERAATERCDRPAWLGYGSSATQCAPFTRLGRFINSKGTRFVFICRRYDVSSPTDSNFENINFIAHNPQSGKTCYFNNRLDGRATNGSKIPPPNTPTSDRFWMDMGDIKTERCPSCHDSDPWMHSPWVDQAVDANGHSLVPMIGQDTAYSVTTKYSIFGRESFVGTDAESKANWKQPQHLTNVGACGTCHRIGAATTMRTWSARSVGNSDWQATWVTPAFRTFSKLHWMPTTPVSEATWASSPDAQSANKIAACASNPSSCGVQDVPH